MEEDNPSVKRALLTVLVLTFNEEKNLPHCLGSVAGWANDIFVIDSGSEDKTCEIAHKHGARVFEHSFERHAMQWNWAFENTPIRTEWVLALDADHRLTRELREEISETIPSTSSSIDGYYVKRRQIFRGRWIKHGGYYPKYMLKLFRFGKVRSDENEYLDFRFYVPGRTLKLRHDFIEDNLNDADLDFWLRKHIRFAVLQAQEELLRNHGDVLWGARPSVFGTPDQQVLQAKQIWYRMPLYFRSLFYFFYRYFLRLGFLDGKEGFLFHFLQGFWYRILVDIKLEEFRRAKQQD